MDLVLQSGALPHELGTARHPTPGKTRRLLGQPDRREEARPEQSGEGAGVELVRLGPGGPDALGDRRVGDDHPGDVGLDQPGDGEGVAGRFQPDLIGRLERVGERHQRGPSGRDPWMSTDISVFEDRHLAEITMDVETYRAHPISSRHRGRQAGERQLRMRARSTTGPVAGAANYNSGLEAHSDGSRPAQPAFSREPRTRWPRT